jgi:hypothetical protein
MGSNADNFSPVRSSSLEPERNQRFQFGFEIECDGPLAIIEKTGLMSRGMASSMPLRAG